ncbi:MAG: hypothetical protein ACK5JN_02860 [Kluyvera sp.]|uniref:hypothetical protein n=1 Tax=Kluyvera sp. TaxID=1538228 RepID=UPI003A83CAAE
MGKINIWTDAEVAFLKQNYGNIPRGQIAAALGRTESAIISKATSMGFRTPGKKVAPVDTVKQLKADGYTIAAIAEHLNITLHQVNHCLYHMKHSSVAFTPRPRITWSKEKIAILVQRAKTSVPVEQIARELGATPAAVRVKASTLGLVLPKGRKSYSQLDIDLAHQMKNAGFRMRQIAAKLDDPPISIGTVRRILSNESPSWEMV